MVVTLFKVMNHSSHVIVHYDDHDHDHDDHLLLCLFVNVNIK
jgi:hypothetical protein